MEKIQHGLHFGLTGGSGLVGTHNPAPNGGVTHEKPGVDAEPAFHAGEILAEATPVPGHPGDETFERHTLDPGKHPGQVVMILGLGRGQREPAVSADHRRDAVQRRGCRVPVPAQLSVVVGVHVDYPGCHDQPGCVNGSDRRLVHRADGHHHSVAHPDVSPSPGRPGAVDDLSPAHYQVEHDISPSFAVSLPRGGGSICGVGSGRLPSSLCRDRSQGGVEGRHRLAE